MDMLMGAGSSAAGGAAGSAAGGTAASTMSNGLMNAAPSMFSQPGIAAGTTFSAVPQGAGMFASFPSAATSIVPNGAANFLGQLGSSAGNAALQAGANAGQNAMGMGQQQQPPVAPPSPVVRPPAGPPTRIPSTAMATPSARKPIPPMGGGQNMAGMSLQQLLELKKRGLT